MRTKRRAHGKARENGLRDGGDVVALRIAYWLACLSPSGAHRCDIEQEMGRMLALPQGALETAPTGFSPPKVTTAWPGGSQPGAQPPR